MIFQEQKHLSFFPYFSMLANNSKTSCIINISFKHFIFVTTV